MAPLLAHLWPLSSSYGVIKPILVAEELADTFLTRFALLKLSTCRVSGKNSNV